MRAAAVLLCTAVVGIAEVRKPRDEADLRFWIETMARHHYSVSEMETVTGLSSNELTARLPAPAGYHPPLVVLPYPGGRHPRIGFLDGAVNPQRETKVSVFTPWDPGSYVVVDVPEAIWSQHGLLYLAHTHVPTIWTRQGIELPSLEWNRRPDGSLEIERLLPNAVSFGAKVMPSDAAVRMELWLRNGTTETLRDLRVQTCVMLKGVAGFNQQTNNNKVLAAPFAACRSVDGKRWIITAWVPSHRTWANPPVPCLHSDPKFPDCPPGEIRRLRGWLSFYEGQDIEREFKRIEPLLN